LDVRAREDVLNIVRQIPNDNRHLIYVTHHIEELIPTISHVLLIKDGRILSAGKKEDVLTDKKLSETYKTNVEIIFNNNRPSLVIKDVEDKDEKNIYSNYNVNHKGATSKTNL